MSAHLWQIDWRAMGYPYCGVYVISTDSFTPCKIGVSVSPVKRLSGLQTSHWRRLEICGYRWCQDTAGAIKVEETAHRILTEEGKLLLGEWFDIRPEKAEEAIDYAGLILGIEVNKNAPDRQIELASQVLTFKKAKRRENNIVAAIR